MLSKNKNREKYLKAAFSMILSVAVLCFVYKVFGMYFLEDETFANYFFYMNAKYNEPHLFFHEEYFLVNNLIFFLQKRFLEINFFGWYKILSVFILLFSFIYLVLSLIKAKWKVFFIIACSILILMPAFVFINNVVLSFLFSAMAFLYIVFAKKTNIDFIYCFYILLFFAVTSRMKVALIAFVIFLFFGILFWQRNKLKHIIIVVSLVAICYSGFIFSSRFYPQSLQDFYTYELMIYDKYDLKLEDIYFQETNFNNYNQQDLLVLGKAMMILDEPTLQEISFESIQKSKNIHQYFFENNLIEQIINYKAQNILSFVKKNSFLILAILCLSLMLSIKHKMLIKTCLFYSFIFTTISFISYAGTANNKFLLSLLITFFLLLILKIKDVKYNIFLMPILLVLSLVHFYSSTLPEIHKKQIDEEARQELFVTYLENNQRGFYNYGTYFYNQIFPSKVLFSYHPLEFYFIDIMGYSEYPVVRKMNKLHFGKKYKDLSHRYLFVKENGGFLYGDNFKISFLKNYLEKVHQIHIEFEKTDEFQNGLSQYLIVKTTN